MATTLFFRFSTTCLKAIPQNGYQDLLRVNGTLSSSQLDTSLTTPAAPAERPFLLNGLPVGFWSERLATEATISGAITFSMEGQVSASTVTARFRAYLYKITSGGSDVETLIGSADATSNLTTGSVTYDFSFTPSAPVTVSRGERFVLRPVVAPDVTGYGTGAVTYTGRMYYGFTSDICKVTFTETLTFLDNGLKLFFRSTTANGIGNFFDLIEGETFTDALKEAVVNTVGGGTEIQWTRTAGGTVLEWVSGRVKAPGWTPADPSSVQGQLAAFESAAQANCRFELKFWRRRPDGSETLILTMLQISELPTSAQTNPFFFSSFTNPPTFAEDDRLVARAYIANIGTMGSGRTCSLQYDTRIVNASYLLLLDPPEVKAEADPNGTSRIAGGLPMSGIGN